jgi:hypothetical protein
MRTTCRMLIILRIMLGRRLPNPSTDSTLDHLLAFTIRFSKQSAQCTINRMVLVMNSLQTVSFTSQSAIRRRETFVKMQNFHRKCTTAKNKSRGFWGFLKGDHRNRTVSEIVDPVDKNKKFR